MDTAPADDDEAALEKWAELARSVIKTNQDKIVTMTVEATAEYHQSFEDAVAAHQERVQSSTATLKKDFDVFNFKRAGILSGIDYTLVDTVDHQKAALASVEDRLGMLTARGGHGKRKATNAPASVTPTSKRGRSSSA